MCFKGASRMAQNLTNLRRLWTVVPWYYVADDGEGVDALEGEEGEDDGEEEVKADADIPASDLRTIEIQELPNVLSINCLHRIPI